MFLNKLFVYCLPMATFIRGLMRNALVAGYVSKKVVWSWIFLNDLKGKFLKWTRNFASVTARKDFDWGRVVFWWQHAAFCKKRTTIKPRNKKCKVEVEGPVVCQGRDLEKRFLRGRVDLSFTWSLSKYCGRGRPKAKSNSWTTYSFDDSAQHLYHLIVKKYKAKAGTPWTCTTPEVHADKVVYINVVPCKKAVNLY